MAKYVDSVAVAVPAWLAAWATAWFTSTPEIPGVERNAAIPPEDPRNRPSGSIFPGRGIPFPGRRVTIQKLGKSDSRTSVT